MASLVPCFCNMVSGGTDEWQVYRSRNVDSIQMMYSFLSRLDMTVIES